MGEKGPIPKTFLNSDFVPKSTRKSHQAERLFSQFQKTSINHRIGIKCTSMSVDSKYHDFKREAKKETSNPWMVPRTHCLWKAWSSSWRRRSTRCRGRRGATSPGTPGTARSPFPRSAWSPRPRSARSQRSRLLNYNRRWSQINTWRWKTGRDDR